MCLSEFLTWDLLDILVRLKAAETISEATRKQREQLEIRGEPIEISI